MKIEAVVFDLDNTIYPEKDYFKAIFTEFSLSNNFRFSVFNFLFEDFNNIRFTKKDIFKFALEQANIYSEDFHNQLFNLYIQINIRIKPYEGAFEWVNDCLNKKKNQLPLNHASNSNEPRGPFGRTRIFCRCF